VVGAGAEDRLLLGSSEQEPRKAIIARRQLAAGKAVLRSVMPAM